jgi:hypothetical protein
MRSAAHLWRYVLDESGREAPGSSGQIGDGSVEILVAATRSQERWGDGVEFCRFQ